MNRFVGYVHREGTQIVDGAGRPLLLRGVGLGNWLLPEGYMWRFGDGLASPREIEAHIDRLVGMERAAAFWSRFRNEFISEPDIAAIAADGYDHVRVPINARLVQDDRGNLREDGVALLDRLIAWCRAHGLLVLLDLHGAPGGQTGTNIDDSVNGQPELFMNEHYRRRTLELWRALAERYRDETAVLGYDLLNEPLPNEWQYVHADDLARLYVDLTAAIREVDQNHLLMYEGSHWATNWSIFTAVWDDNSALQFHRYWCPPDQSSIQEYLDVRARLGLPIYMGEGGENNPEWIYAATRLYERHDIGWNFWPWKKLETRTSPRSMRVPSGWDAIRDPSASLDSDSAWNILQEYLDNASMERCDVHDEVTNALFARAPLRLPAWAYAAAHADPASPGVPSGAGEGVGVIRLEDPVLVRLASGSDRQPNWHHDDGRPYGPDEGLEVVLPPGWSLSFAATGNPSSAVQVLDGRGEPIAVAVERARGSITITTGAEVALGSLIVE